MTYYAYALFDRVIAFHPNVWDLKRPENMSHGSISRRAWIRSQSDEKIEVNLGGLNTYFK